jgi:hypothetical protein
MTKFTTKQLFWIAKSNNNTQKNVLNCVANYGESLNFKNVPEQYIK